MASLIGNRHSRDGYAIAAAMLPFPSVTRDGTPVQDASPDYWLDCLNEVAAAGFTEVDVMDTWLRAGDLPPERLAQLAGVLDESSLHAEAISLIRRSVIDPVRGDENLAYSHRTLEAAAQLGCSTVSVGFHRPLTAAQQSVLWFWTVDGPSDLNDPVGWEPAVRRIRELGQHAASLGLMLSLEMHENTFLGSAGSAVRLVEEIGVESVGLNPDLGNLIRVQGPIEPWQETLSKCLPYTNYWHVKNYLRFEDPLKGVVLTAPATLDTGLIDYRAAVRDALDAGFTGAFCVEHYGGDSFSAGATNMRYLRQLLRRP